MKIIHILFLASIIFSLVWAEEFFPCGFWAIWNDTCEFDSFPVDGFSTPEGEILKSTEANFFITNIPGKWECRRISKIINFARNNNFKLIPVGDTVTSRDSWYINHFYYFLQEFWDITHWRCPPQGDSGYEDTARRMLSNVRQIYVNNPFYLATFISGENTSRNTNYFEGIKWYNTVMKESSPNAKSLVAAGWEDVYFSLLESCPTIDYWLTEIHPFCEDVIGTPTPSTQQAFNWLINFLNKTGYHIKQHQQRHPIKWIFIGEASEIYHWKQSSREWRLFSRRPTPNEIKCQAYLALSRGAKGIGYFLYLTKPFYTPPPDTTRIYEALFGLVDTIGRGDFRPPWEPYFSTVKNVFLNIKKIAPTINQIFYDTAVSITPYTHFSGIKYIQKVRPLNVVDSFYHEIAIFQPLSNTDYFMLVNRLCDSNETVLVEVTIKKPRGEYVVKDIATGEIIHLEPLIGDTLFGFFTKIYPGEGKLFALFEEPIPYNATAFNQSHHLGRKINDDYLHWCYHSQNNIWYQTQNELIYPPVSIAQGKFPSIFLRGENPWICYKRNDSIICVIKVDNFYPGNWKKINVFSGMEVGPPSLVLSQVYPGDYGSMGYIVYEKKDFRRGKNYICFNAFDSLGIHYTTVLDSGNIPTEFLEKDCYVSSPSIALTYGDYLHIVWEKEGRIYYKTTLQRVYPHLIRRGEPIIWSAIMRVSTELPLPITEPASNPSVEAQGEWVYVVWRGPNEEGNRDFGEIWQRVGKIRPGHNPEWRDPENISKSPLRESNYPQMSTGAVCVWQEFLPNNNEVYGNIKFLRPETLNISRTGNNSFFPNLNVLPTFSYWCLFNLWTEEISEGVYKINNKKLSFFIAPPVEPPAIIDMVVGQPEPSLYCLKRDGYNDLATYPYDYGKELIYKIPYLHPEKYYLLSLIFYLETFGQSSQREEKAEIIINNQIIDTVSFLPFIPETCNFEIPYGLYESTYVILKIRNIFGANCGVSSIKVYEYEKIDDESGGSQNLSSFSINDFILYPYPNPARNNLFIKYQLPKEDVISISLYDISGKKIKEIREKKKRGIYEIKLNTKEIPSGIYFLYLKTNNLQDMKKVVITR